MTNDKEQKLKAAAIEILKQKGWYDENVSAGNYRIPMPYVLDFMIEFSSEQAKEIETLKDELSEMTAEKTLQKELKEERQYEIKRLKSQLEAKAVDVEEISNKYFHEFAIGKRTPYAIFEFKEGVDPFDILNFFLSHLQPGKSDAVEFAEWILSDVNFIDGDEIKRSYIYRGDIKTTEELYQQYLKEKK